MDKKRSVELGFLGINIWRLRSKDTRLCFGNTNQMAAFIVKMAQHLIPRHVGSAQVWLHLHQTDSDSRHQNWLHIRPECHLCHPATLWEPMLSTSKVCYPVICIYMLLFPALNFAILMNIPRIVSVIKILIQICWLMKAHPLVCTLSALW